MNLSGIHQAMKIEDMEDNSRNLNENITQSLPPYTER